jgi:hypothetical protein
MIGASTIERRMLTERGGRLQWALAGKRLLSLCGCLGGEVAEMRCSGSYVAKRHAKWQPCGRPMRARVNVSAPRLCRWQAATGCARLVREQLVTGIAAAQRAVASMRIGAAVAVADGSSGAQGDGTDTMGHGSDGNRSNVWCSKQRNWWQFHMMCCAREEAGR